MKRIFYRIDNNLYFDLEGFMAMAEGSGLNVQDLEGMPIIREGKTLENIFNHLVM